MTGVEADLAVKNLAALAKARLAAIGALRVSGRQEIMGGSFAESLEAWRLAPSNHVLGLCFLHRDRPVGMTLFKRPTLSPAWVLADAASIHGLKIAEPWQGRGWGHQAFRLAVNRLKQEWPAANTLMLAVDANNRRSRRVSRIRHDW